MYKIRGTKVVSPYPTTLTPAETRLVFALQRLFPPGQIFPDLYLPKVNFRTKFSADFTNFTLNSMHQKVIGSELVQIDCLAVNDRGIFVFESKDYAGWIYGSLDQQRWTQVLNFGKEKHSFYNPIKQNQLHLNALADFLDHVLLYSIIVFGNEATLKTTFTPPANCLITNQSALSSAIKKLPQNLLSPDQVANAIHELDTHRILPTGSLRQDHISDIKTIKT